MLKRAIGIALALTASAIESGAASADASGMDGVVRASGATASAPSRPSASSTARAPAWAGAAYAPRPDGRKVGVAELEALGRRLFIDPSLSASGKTSCASCHDPAAAYGPSNALSLQLAGRDGATPGLRAAPSLRYLQTLPPFSEHHFDNEGDDSVDAGPTGGHAWDGRASSAHEQARLPLLSAQEMANASPEEVVAKLERGSSADDFRRLFGPDVFTNRAGAFDAALMALETFQQSPRDFYPYTSKYDRVLRHQAVLTPQEARGLQWFDDPAKGNCAACHRSSSADGSFPTFTDFGLIALGVPRLRSAPANADPAFFDLGLCGPLRTDFTSRDDYCGRFRTPSLRNVAARQSFFHNGVMHSLHDVLRFYASRDLDPGRFYGRAGDGEVVPFDDLPARFHGNPNREPPFDRRAGMAAALDAAEIDDVIAFLHTLTDRDALPDAARADAAQARAEAGPRAVVSAASAAPERR